MGPDDNVSRHADGHSVELKNELHEDLRRKSNVEKADAAAAVEQAQRSTQEWREAEVNLELRRAVAAKQADQAVTAEHQAQVAKPRRPSAELSAAIASVQVDVVRKPTLDAKNELNEDLRRKSNVEKADAAAAVEQAQRSTQEWREAEVNLELRRAVAAKQADQAVTAEHQAQVAKPRRPSAELSAAITSLHTEISSMTG